MNTTVKGQHPGYQKSRVLTTAAAAATEGWGRWAFIVQERPEGRKTCPELLT